jgi:hypothetical protein
MAQHWQQRVHEIAHSMLNRHYLERQHELDEQSNRQRARELIALRADTSRTELQHKLILQADEWNRRHKLQLAEKQKAEEPDVSKLYTHYSDQLNRQRKEARERVQETRKPEPGSAAAAGEGPDMLPPHLLEINHRNTVKQLVEKHLEDYRRLKDIHQTIEEGGAGTPGGKNVQTKDVEPGEETPPPEKPPQKVTPPKGANAQLNAARERLQATGGNVQPVTRTEEEKTAEAGPDLEKLTSAHDLLRRAYAAASFAHKEAARINGGPFYAAQQMRDILARAIARKGKLTRQELDEYRRHHARLPAIPFTDAVNLGE